MIKGIVLEEFKYGYAAQLVSYFSGQFFFDLVVPVIYSYLDSWEKRLFRRGLTPRGAITLDSQPADKER